MEGDLSGMNFDVFDDMSFLTLEADGTLTGSDFGDVLDFAEATDQEDALFAGLLNQGATCYLNSLLQALYMTPEFRSALYELAPDDLLVRYSLAKDDEAQENPAIQEITAMGFEVAAARAAVLRFPDDSQQQERIEFILSGGALLEPAPQEAELVKERAIPKQLQRLFARLQTCVAKAQSTKPLTKEFGEGFSGGVQHDVHELSRILFDRIEKQLRGTSASDLIARLYRGVTVNRSEREEPYLDISVVIQQHDDLLASLTDYVSDEQLDGDNQYKCSGCNEMQDATRGLRIKSLPPVLIISLSRFEYDTTTWERMKNTRTFPFPFELNMAPYCDEPPELPIFDLFGVVIHCGQQAGYGHYHAYLRDVCAQGDEPVWCDFNDSRVTSISSDQVKTQYGGESECAYMLVYRQRGSPLLTSVPPKLPPHLLDLVESDRKQVEAEKKRIEDAKYLHRYKVFSGRHFKVVDRGVARVHKKSDSHATIEFDSRLTWAEFRSRAAAALNIGADTVMIAHDVQIRDRRLKFLGKIKAKDGDPIHECKSVSEKRAVLFWDGEHLGDGDAFEILWNSIVINVARYTNDGKCHQEYFAAIPSDTVGTLRSRLAARHNETDLWLFLWGKKKAYLAEKDELTLKELHVKDGSRISVEVARDDGDVSLSYSCKSVAKNHVSPGVDSPISIFVTNNCDDTHLEKSVLSSTQSTIIELKMSIIEAVGTLNESKPMRLRRTAVGGTPADLFAHEHLKLERAGLTDNSRVILEYGEPPDSENFTLNYIWGTASGNKLADPMPINVSRSLTVEQVKIMVMEELNLISSDPAAFRLRRADFWGSQGDIFIDEQLNLRELRLNESDTLWLEEGRVPRKGYIELTHLGFAQVAKKSTLSELKQTLELPGFCRFWVDDTLCVDKDGSSTLKSHGICTSCVVDVQTMDAVEAPEILNDHAVLIWAIQRCDAKYQPPVSILLSRQDDDPQFESAHVLQQLKGALRLSSSQQIVFCRKPQRFNRNGKFRVVVDENKVEQEAEMEMEPKKPGLRALRAMQKQQEKTKIHLTHGDVLVWKLTSDTEETSLEDALNPESSKGYANPAYQGPTTNVRRYRPAERALDIEDDDFFR